MKQNPVMQPNDLDYCSHTTLDEWMLLARKAMAIINGKNQDIKSAIWRSASDPSV